MYASESYMTQAKVLENVIQTFTATNADMQGRFENQTLQAFIERYESEYKESLEKTQEALQSISEFLTTYVDINGGFLPLQIYQELID